jgi:2-polyprenyl-6-methoxyphenol hydroxylase-like FAD-dependent oxidoreductase
MLDCCPDVAVIGAGPVGCVAALAFARQGRRVVLLEGNPRSAHRLAGELLHPSAVQALEKLGLRSLVREGHPARGFAVFPPDGSAPIFLRYPVGATGMTCDHWSLVTALRQAAASHEGIRVLAGAQATGVEGQRLYFKTPERPSQSVTAALIVGADGRSSLARKCLGLADERTHLSSMAGVLIEDVDLVRDGFNQVMLGGPGPVLACDIGSRRIRLFLDVPPRTIAKDAASLWTAFHEVLHPTWREPFRKALAGPSLTWASNQWRPRRCYGRPGLALVGDAVGCYHPLTAVGLTLGFLDACCLAESRSFAEYRRRRTAQCGVAPLLAHSLYKVFANNDPGAAALRGAVFRMWRRCPAERGRTMRLLSGDDSDILHFHRAFIRVLALAVQTAVLESVLAGRWRHTARVLGGFTTWVNWLAAG